MKIFSWNDEKNASLKSDRQVCFEDVVISIEMGLLLDILEYPNQERYKGQKILIIQIDHYVYLVPFVENDKEVFLKTIIPSRKATRRYIKGSNYSQGACLNEELSVKKEKEFISVEI